MNSAKSAFSNAQAALSAAQNANSNAQAALAVAKAAYDAAHAAFDSASANLSAAQKAVYNAQCEKAEADRLLALALAYHPIRALPSTLQYCDTIYNNIEVDCRPYNFPSCSGAERVEAFGTNTITLSSGRIILYGGCTNFTGHKVHKGKYISWRGITIKGDTHAHQIYCQWFIDVIVEIYV